MDSWRIPAAVRRRMAADAVEKLSIVSWPAFLIENIGFA
jgi:hypothetical protein